MPRPGAAAAGAAARPRRGTRSSGECPELAAVQGPRGGGRGPWRWEGRSAEVSAGPRGGSPWRVLQGAGTRVLGANLLGALAGRKGGGHGQGGPGARKARQGHPWARGARVGAAELRRHSRAPWARALLLRRGARPGQERAVRRRARGGRRRAAGRAREAGRERGCRRGATSALRRVRGAQAWLRVWNAGC